MNIWNKIETVDNYKLSFYKVKKGTNKYNETSGKIFFYDKSSDNGGGYIDLYTSTCYYRINQNLPYAITRLTDSSVIVQFNRPMYLRSYSDVDGINDYLFWSENVESTDNIIIKEHTEYRMREKEQVKSTDNTQDWADTGRFRDDPDFDVIVDGCMCSSEFRWELNGTICDGINKCNKYILQRKDDCDSEWIDYTPIVEKIGEIIEFDSSECGTHEYKEEWETTEYCGSELNEKYGYNLIPTNKYIIEFAYIKSKDSEDWELVNCGKPLGYKLVKENSFECGWYKEKIETVTVNDLCGSAVKEQYPSLTNIIDTNKYNVIENHYFKTEPYPTNTDDMTEDEWIWKEINVTYNSTIVETNSCDCGYFYLQWDATDEYSCGSELGSGYTETTQYQKYVQNKYCGDTLLEENLDIEWRTSDATSCECGYRISGYSIDESVGYEYVCGNGIQGLEEGYMYYKEYKYTECVDGSNREMDKVNDIRYIKASHNSIVEKSCEYDESLSANTTQVLTTYRVYTDKNENKYVKVDCDGFVITNVEKNEKSESCGYLERWSVSGTVCCGNLENDAPVEFNIISTEGNWTRDDNKFTSNIINDNESTIMNIEFSLNDKADIVIDYDISSERNYDRFYYDLYRVDGMETINPHLGGISGEETGTYRIIDVVKGNYILSLKYQKDSANSSGRDNVIVTVYADRINCNKYGKYQAKYFEYSVDGGENWIIPQPTEWAYGNLIEAQSEECGYIPTLTQWKLLCPDITADNYQTPEDLDECVECHNQQGVPSLFAIEYEQESTDGGITWKDTGKTRTEKLLKWKSKACGYTGDIFETRWTNEYCNGKDLYGTKTTWVSSDNGQTWREVEGSSTVELKEKDAAQCQGEEGGV